ncbi:novel plant SNARE 11-like [Impatiens glandulifera]|uniref:novel plant SNARE 11-like n=1 Tax=Impatiens glandulifera TaxID=253017 RepID=UPI001FB056FC|nr:novel plant SNARE 11-like [Impatiens glandulifera]
MASLSTISNELGEIEGQITDVLRSLSNGFQKLDKIKDPGRQNRQLEELTEKMRDCKRLIKDFDQEIKDLGHKSNPDTDKLLTERKQSMIKELNSYVALKKKYASNIDNKRIDLFDEPGEGLTEDNVFLASSMTNQQLVGEGHRMMDQTDDSIERSKKVVQETINVGTETAATLKSQTEQMSRIVNELDSIHFSMKKATKLAKELGRQIATDHCIRTMLALIVFGVIAIITVKVLNPHNKDIRDIPGLAPPVQNRRLLWNKS